MTPTQAHTNAQYMNKEVGCAYIVWKVFNFKTQKYEFNFDSYGRWLRGEVSYDCRSMKYDSPELVRIYGDQ